MDNSLSIVKNRLKSLGKVAVCFSGGMDSTALLSLAKEALGDGVTAVMVDVPMLSERIRDIALIVSSRLDCRLVTAKLEWQDMEGILENGSDRCYICKRAMYKAVRKVAEDHGIRWILNGDTADDDPSTRPGMRAAEEAGVLSPLRDAGVSRARVKEYVDSLELPLDLVKETCMLMRFPIGVPVTEEDLETVEDIEYGIRSISEVKQLRVRMDGTRHLRLQTSAEEMQKLHDCEEDLRYYLDSIGYTYEVLRDPYAG